ncbi:hypothetical protein KI387_005939, partial [Taxus chinensis]
FVMILLLCTTAQIKGSGWVVLVDNPDHRYFRTQSQEAHMTQSDVAAAMSVLLGFAPAASHPSISSSKLDALLTPNPFKRPHAVFMLEARGINQVTLSGLDFSKFGLESYSQRRLVDESNRTAFDLPENEVMLESLNGISDDDCDVHSVEKELLDLALWLGGSYTGGHQPLQGNLSIPLSEELMTFNLLKGADQIFAKELISLHQNIRRVAAIHEDLAKSSQDTTELLIGSFVGVKALQEYYGNDNIPQQGLDVFLNVVVKLFHSLRLSYGGQIVGIISINSNVVPSSDGMFDVKLSSRNSRWLSELGPFKSSAMSNSTIAEVKLVRRAIAWSTGLILLIATLVG